MLLDVTKLATLRAVVARGSFSGAGNDLAHPESGDFDQLIKAPRFFVSAQKRG